MCVKQNQMDVKAEMKVYHVPQGDPFQETDSADTQTQFLAILNQPAGKKKTLWRQAVWKM